MSSEKGKRKRHQKHQNKAAFRNDLHDTTPKTKFINSLVISGVCTRCQEILEWKIKFKKYKPLTVPRKCNKCEQKTVRHAYHTLCELCAEKCDVCAKCGKEPAVMKTAPSPQEQARLESELQQQLKSLPERKRRTILRNLSKQQKGHREGDEKGNGIYHKLKEDTLPKLKELAAEVKKDEETWSDMDNLSLRESDSE